MKCFLTLIETAGNQPFIFATNRLRQNVGASELIFRVGIRTLVAAGVGTEEELLDTATRAERLTKSKPINDPGTKHEVIYATSGKALLLSNSKEAADEVVRRVTEWALREAPGLDVCGATVKLDLDQGSVHQASHDATERLAQNRGRLPSPLARFPRLPIIASCSSSGLPASSLEWLGKPTQEPASMVAKKKYRSAEGTADTEGAYDRFLKHVAKDHITLATSIAEVEQRAENLEWLAVVHADGNGLGAVFRDLDKKINKFCGKGNRTYIERLRGFSLGLELAAERAFRKALEAVGEGKNRVLVPLVLGGDDLTVVCEGRLAIPFAKAYLESFEEEVGNGDDPENAKLLSGIAEEPKSPPLTAAAGIAVIKPHYPFHLAYELSERLLKSAKGAKPASALDFHVLYDSSATKLTEIRRRRRSADQDSKSAARLFGGPYLVGLGRPGGKFKGLRYSDLEARASAVNERDDGKRVIPNVVLHRMRSSLYRNSEVANVTSQQIKGRHPKLAAVLKDSGGVFWDDSQADWAKASAFVDVMDLAGLLEAKEQ